MKTIKNTMMKILPVVLVLFWTGCEDLDFPDPNNPTSDTATIQSLVTGAEAQMLSGFGVWVRVWGVSVRWFVVCWNMLALLYKATSSGRDLEEIIE